MWLHYAYPFKVIEVCYACFSKRWEPIAHECDLTKEEYAKKQKPI